MDRGLLWWALKSRWSCGDDGTYFARYSMVGNIGMFSFFPFPFLFDNVCVLSVVAKEAYCFYYIPASLHCAHSGRVPIT